MADDGDDDLLGELLASLHARHEQHKRARDDDTELLVALLPHSDLANKWRRTSSYTAFVGNDQKLASAAVILRDTTPVIGGHPQPGFPDALPHSPDPFCDGEPKPRFAAAVPHQPVALAAGAPEPAFASTLVHEPGTDFPDALPADGGQVVLHDFPIHVAAACNLEPVLADQHDMAEELASISLGAIPSDMARLPPAIRWRLPPDGIKAACIARHAISVVEAIRRKAKNLVVFKIGLTQDIARRWNHKQFGYKSEGFHEMHIVMAANGLACGLLEVHLITLFKHVPGCYNIAPGGEGIINGGAGVDECYTYVACKYLEKSHAHA
jgi:hypothetical protein